MSSGGKYSNDEAVSARFADEEEEVVVVVVVVAKARAAAGGEMLVWWFTDVAIPRRFLPAECGGEHLVNAFSVVSRGNA
jgi:hypothetical protein